MAIRKPTWFILCPGRIPKLDKFRARPPTSPREVEAWTAVVQAERLEDWRADFVLRPGSSREDGTPGAVLVSGWLAPIVHQSVKDALEADGIRDIQFLPVLVQHLDGSDIPGYFVLNITSALFGSREEVPYPLGLEAHIAERSGDDPEVLPSERLRGHDALWIHPQAGIAYVSERFMKAFQRTTQGQYVFLPVAVS